MSEKVDYTIQLSTGTQVPLLFNTWGFRQYSLKKGIELDALEKKIFEQGKPFEISDVPDVLLIAHETYCKYNGKPFTATELEACEWLDETGGTRSPLYYEVYKKFMAKFLNIPEKELEVKETAKKEEKPKKKEARSPGVSSTPSPLQPV